MNKYRVMAKNIVLVSAMISLTACGGGGGGGDEGGDAGGAGGTSSGDVGSIVKDYSPDSDKIESAAGNSEELYVEEGFMFRYSNAVRLSVSALDLEGDPKEEAILSVYSVSSDIEEWTDDLMEDAALIAKGRTDSQGRFERTLELYRADTQLLLVLNTIGIENKVLVPVLSDAVKFDFY